MSDYIDILKDSMLILVESIITDPDSLVNNNKGGLMIEVIIALYDPIEYGRKYLEGLSEVYTIHPKIDPVNVCVQTLITNAISYFLTN